MEIEKNRDIIQNYYSINEPLITENRYYESGDLSDAGDLQTTEHSEALNNNKQKVSKGMIYAFCTTIFLVAIAFFLKLVYMQQAELQT